MFRLLLLLIYLFSLLVTTSPVYADTELEKANLARINNALNSLKPLINEAEREQDPSARVQFHYDWLRNDIARIQQGIDQQLKQAPIEPRTIIPLTRDYITYRSKHI